MTDLTAHPPQWRLDTTDQHNRLVLSGDWTSHSGKLLHFPSDGLKQAQAGQPLVFDTADLGRWNTALIGFLWQVKQATAQAGMGFGSDSLPQSARKLLDLLPERPPAPAAPRHTPFRPDRNRHGD